MLHGPPGVKGRYCGRTRIAFPPEAEVSHRRGGCSGSPSPRGRARPCRSSLPWRQLLGCPSSPANMAPCSVSAWPVCKPRANISGCPPAPLGSWHPSKVGNGFRGWRPLPHRWLFESTGLVSQGLTQAQTSHSRARESELYTAVSTPGPASRHGRRKLHRKGPSQTRPDTQSVPETREDTGWRLKATAFWGNPARKPLGGISLFCFGFSSPNRPTP